MLKYISSKNFKSNNSNNMFGTPSDEDYELIKTYLNGDIDKESLFVYPVLLCGNEVDRVGEQFTHESLVEMADLMTGVTGILDHEHKSGNQHSVVYKTELCASDLKNQLNEPYEYLVGYCYMLNNDKNKQLIEEIKAGIKDGVSVGFNNKNTECSICGKNMLNGECNHTKLQTYDGKLCIGKLKDITDAYEWSFVAIPCQSEAGVIKEYNTNKEEISMKLEDIIAKACKSLSDEEAGLVMKAFDSNKSNELANTVKELELKVKAYEEENQALREQINAEKLCKAKSLVYDGAEPVDEKADGLIDYVLKDILKIGEDGEVVGVDEAKELIHNDYNYLLKKAEEQSEPVIESVDTTIEKSIDVNKIINKGDGFTIGVKTNKKSFVDRSSEYNPRMFNR